MRRGHHSPRYGLETRAYRRRPSPERLRDAGLRRLRALNVMLAVAAVVLLVGFTALSAGATTAKQRTKARIVASATPTPDPHVTRRARAHRRRRHHHHHHHHHAAATPAATAAPTSVAPAAPTAVPTATATPVPTPVPTAQAPVVVAGGS